MWIGPSNSESRALIYKTLNLPQSRFVPTHDDVMKWKHFPRYWSFVRGIHWSPVNSPHKGQWRGALMFSLICAWMNGWVSTIVRLLIWDANTPIMTSPEWCSWECFITTLNELTKFIFRLISAGENNIPDAMEIVMRRHGMGTLSTLLTICERNPPGNGDSPHKRQSYGAWILSLLLYVLSNLIEICDKALSVNPLRPRRNDCQFANDTSILIKISQRSINKDQLTR